MALGGCGDSDPPVGIVGHVQGDFGGVVSDEPRATLIARDTLSAGGTAVDAVVALYFALAASYPASAGLGGGGVCVVHHAESKKAEALDFTVRAPAGRVPSGRFAVAVPGNVRGMFALHSRYGRLRWEQLVFPGERMARFGSPVSRAFAAELAQGMDRLRSDGEARRLFRRPDGKPLREGDNLQQLDLSTILGQIRAKGPGELYNGVLARKFVVSVAAAGGVLGIEDLRAYRPVWSETVKGSFGNHDVHFAPGGGATVGRLWDLLAEKGRYRGASSGERERVIVETLREVQAASPAGRAVGADGRMRDPAVTGFAAMDISGGAAACAVTMNGRFGTGRMIPGTGMFAARPPRTDTDGTASLTAMIVANRHTGNAYFSGAASGSAAAPASMISVALRVLLDDRKLKAAIAVPRFHPGAAERSVLAEARQAGGAAESFRKGGYRVATTRKMGRVHAIYCAGGIMNEFDSCQYAADPRGFGFAASAER